MLHQIENKRSIWGVIGICLIIALGSSVVGFIKYQHNEPVKSAKHHHTDAQRLIDAVAELSDADKQEYLSWFTPEMKKVIVDEWFEYEMSEEESRD